MANKFVVWIPTPTVNTNIQSQETFAGDEQTRDGFEAGHPASAIRVNTAIRQANLVACALMNVLIPDNNTLSVESSVGDLTTELLKHLSVDLNLINGTGSKSIRNKDGGTASGTGSGSFGYNNTIAHDYSFGFGYNLVSGALYQALFGLWNNPLNNALLIVGNGSGINAKSNAFVVMADGRAKVKTAPSDPEDVARKQEIPVPSSTAPADIAATGSAGTGSAFARADHTHKGVRSIEVNGGVQSGDITNIYSPTSGGSRQGQLIEWNNNKERPQWMDGSIGSSVKPIFIEDGVPTEINGTVGSADQPVYLNNGTITVGARLLTDIGAVSTVSLAGLYEITLKKTSGSYTYYTTVTIRVGPLTNILTRYCSSVGVIDDGSYPLSQYHVIFELVNNQPTFRVRNTTSTASVTNVTIEKVVRVKQLAF